MAQNSSSENGWQESKTTVKERIAHLFNNDCMSDITFVADDVRFPVHKLILGSSSSVFYSMFYGAMAENKQEIDLSHYGNADSISEFLKFIYKGEVLLHWGNVFQILNLANFYLISSLKQKCIEYIEESVTIENLLTAFQQCLIFDESAVIKKCLDEIRANASEIVKQDSFLVLNLESLKAILKLDTLNIEEVDLFLAVNKWCDNQLIKEGKEICAESKREVLGDALYLIRFPTMTLKDFGKHCVQSDLLTHKETNDLIYYLSQDSTDLQQAMVDKIKFSGKPRLGREISADRIPINPQLRNWTFSSIFTDEIEFNINKKALLKGISLFGDPTTNKASNIIVTTDSKTVTPTNIIGEPNSGKIPGSFRVSFGQPIEILPNSKAKVSVDMSESISTAIEKEGTANEFAKNGFECRFFEVYKKINSTYFSSGQFSELLFEVLL